MEEAERREFEREVAEVGEMEKKWVERLAREQAGEELSDLEENRLDYLAYKAKVKQGGA